MSAKREYSCDLCRQRIRYGSDSQIGQAGHGIRWKSNDDMQAVGISDAESHLCLTCIRAVHQIAHQLDVFRGTVA